MLVLAASPGGAGPRWTGRRHDDDAPGAVSGADLGGIFDTVFHALHDGEQIAIGFPGPLVLTLEPGRKTRERSLLATARGAHAAVRELDILLCEIGTWRPWTVLSTSLPRWRATTSILVWETDCDADPEAAVEAFFALLDAGAERGADTLVGETAAVLNLAVALARDGGLSVDPAQLGEPVVRVTAGPPTPGRPAP